MDLTIFVLFCLFQSIWSSRYHMNSFHQYCENWMYGNSSYSLIMKMLTINCFCLLVELRKTLRFVASQDHSQRFSQMQISDTPRAWLETLQNPIPSFVDWIYAAVITTVSKKAKKVNVLSELKVEDFFLKMKSCWDN